MGKAGLIPSSDEVREKMNQEVNRFIDFVASKLNDSSTSLTDEIQQYMLEWDNFDFGTEETDYIVDTLFEVMVMVDVDVDDILI